MKQVHLMRIYSTIFLGLFLSTFDSLADSSGKCGVNAKWNLTEDGVLTISGVGEMKNLTKNSIPWNPSLVSKINIEEGITRIGNHAFRDSKNLQAVYIPTTLKHIGSSAFYNCIKLTKIDFPESLLSIEDKAFENCINLTSINLPESIESIGTQAFKDCKGLVNLLIPESVNSIGINAFLNCNMISEIACIPAFITSENCDRFGLNSNPVEKYRVAKEESYRLTLRQDEKSLVYTKYPDVISDVDIDLPITINHNENRFAFIIANEVYESIGNVPYAIKDGVKFAEYCEKTLGIPNKNVRLYKNATKNNLISVLYEIKRIDDAFEGQADFILYYAGHGVPDGKTLTSYIVPTDAFKPIPDACVSLKELYSKLGDLRTSSVVVFLDACFSGAGRDNTMLSYGERGVALKPKGARLTGNVAVLSATSGDQTAQPYTEKGHGLFTYYLLKILKEKRGDVSLGDIKNYVRENVRKTSASIDLKEQSPTINVSPEVVDVWEDWNLSR